MQIFSLPTLHPKTSYAKPSDNSTICQNMTTGRHQDTLSLRFSGSQPIHEPLNPDSVLNPESSETDYQPYEKNLIAGRVYAKGARGVEANPDTARRFFEQAMADENPDFGLHSKLIVAKTYLDGYYSIQKDPAAALKILDQVLQDAKGNEEQAYFQAEAARLKLKHLPLSPRQRQENVQLLKSALLSEGSNLYLDISTARFFATVMKDPKSAKECALLASKSHLEWNQASETEHPSKSSKGSLGAKEMMALAKDIAQGAKGMPRDSDLAKSLLEILMATVITPNPVFQFEAARIFANDLGDQDRARELVDFMLYESKYPQILEIAGFMAKDLQDPAGAKALLTELEQNPDLIHFAGKTEKTLSPGQRIAMANLYARDLNDPQKAAKLLKSFTFESVGNSSKAVLAMEMAEIYGKSLGSPELARRYLDYAKGWVSWGGSGNPQETRIQLAAAYVDILNDTPAALGVIREAVDLTPRYFGSDDIMRAALKVLDQCDATHPDVEPLQQEARRIIQDITQKSDIHVFSADED